jgi:hypothetical protein
MPLTVTTPERTVILGGPDDEPELYDLTTDPGEQNNVWSEHVAEGATLARAAISSLEDLGTPEEYLSPRRKALGVRRPGEGEELRLERAS